jgi:hypothetical protein
LKNQRVVFPSPDYFVIEITKVAYLLAFGIDRAKKFWSSVTKHAKKDLTLFCSIRKKLYLCILLTIKILGNMTAKFRKGLSASVFITSFNGEDIDISELTIDQLWALHYEQEKSFADIIKKTKPFSAERGVLMKKGYETVNKIMVLRQIKQGKELESYGASDSYIKLIEKLIKKIISKKGKCLFFEAGVGTGKIIKSVVNLKDVTAIGCDVYVDKNFIDSGLTVYESTIYEALLKLPDNNIDIFYWNDVLEHIPEDETEDYIKLLYKKMNTGGIIITITPNRLKGPSDITAHFEPRGTIAKGFHFHEYTFYEVLKMFEKHNIRSGYGFIGSVNKGWYILGPAQCIDKIKLLAEKMFINFPYIIKKKGLAMMGCDVSILKKMGNDESKTQ